MTPCKAGVDIPSPHGEIKATRGEGLVRGDLLSLGMHNGWSRAEGCSLDCCATSHSGGSQTQDLRVPSQEGSQHIPNSACPESRNDLGWKGTLKVI